MVASIAMLAQMNRCIRKFKELNAVSPARAIDPADYGIRRSLIFEKLVRRRVLVPVAAGRFYLDRKTEADYKGQRRKLVFIVLLVVVAAFITAILIG